MKGDESCMINSRSRLTVNFQLVQTSTRVYARLTDHQHQRLLNAHPLLHGQRTGVVDRTLVQTLASQLSSTIILVVGLAFT
jgi:hypothetical protein